MISTRFIKLAVSSFALGMSLTGGHPVSVAPNTASAEAKQLQIAAEAAAKANAAIATKNVRSAVRFSEMAVEYAPRNADYRMMLGQAYLNAGRFSSAETSFSDALTLVPDHGRAALHLALTEIAQGKRDRALATLSDYRERLAVADYGLAMSLAGDVDAGTLTLENAVRTGDSDAKTRQNLALSYAMAGRWANARVTAMQDLSGNDVNDRIAQWASFVRPGSSFDQVASLLGVTPSPDDGQPTRLALNGFVDTAVATAVAPELPVVQPAAPTQIALVDTIASAFETPIAAVSEAISNIIMGERREVVQPLPASYARYAVPAPSARVGLSPSKQMVVARSGVRGVESGKFVVQLGAFENASVSRDAWKRMSARFGLAGYNPANSAAKVGGASFVRLSVGGFATRVEASTVCARIRDAGGPCFVRGLLGDAPAQWVQSGMPKAPKPMRVASR